jgi:hypothetical protein
MIGNELTANELSILARLAALENLTVATLSLYFARGSSDSDRSKIKALLAAIKGVGESGLAHFPQEARDEGVAYLSSLLDQVLQIIPALRAENTGKLN